MSETVLECIERCRRQLYGRNHFQLNRLDASISATDVTLTFDRVLGMIRPGVLLGLGTELLYVWETNDTAKTAVVQRGYLGSTAAAASVDALVEIAPRFARAMIKESIQDEIRSWPDSLYQVFPTTLTVAGGNSGLELSAAFADLIGIVEVFKQPALGSDTWRRMNGVRLLRNLPLDASSSGLMLNLGETVTTGMDIQVIMAFPFATDPWNDNTDLETDSGLSPSMLDIVPLGVSARLLTSNEVDRTDMGGQGEARRATEVPINAMIQTGVNHLRLRDRRIAEEAARLLRDYPIRYRC